MAGRARLGRSEPERVEAMTIPDLDQAALEAATSVVFRAAGTKPFNVGHLELAICAYLPRMPDMTKLAIRKLERSTSKKGVARQAVVNIDGTNLVTG